MPDLSLPKRERGGGKQVVVLAISLHGIRLIVCVCVCVYVCVCVCVCVP